MTGVPKPTPMEAFAANMGDADKLVLLADALTNVRARRMRKELRTKIGAALKISQKDREHLDCAESSDVFVVLMPGGRLDRTNFDQHEPLLRQAIVAACAAVETYLADKVIECSRAAIAKGEPLPRRLGEIGLTVNGWMGVEAYTYRRRGIIEQVIAPVVREQASTSPTKVGQLLSAVGVDKPLAAIDRIRAVAKGDTERPFERITQRRNKIAHEGDRQGHGRRKIFATEVSADLAILKSIVFAIDQVCG